VSLDELLSRFWSEIAERPEGPMAFRFFVQPAVASFFACRDGILDARKQKPAYFWTLFCQFRTSAGTATSGVEIRGRRLHYGDCNRPGLPDGCAARISSGPSCIRRRPSCTAALPHSERPGQQDRQSFQCKRVSIAHHAIVILSFIYASGDNRT